MKSTRDKILDAGVALWPHVSPSSVARAMGLNSHVNVLYYFKTTQALKDAVAQHAVDTENSKVIVQLLAVDHKVVKNMRLTDRARHLKAVQ